MPASVARPRRPATTRCAARGPADARRRVARELAAYFAFLGEDAGRRGARPRRRRLAGRVYDGDRGRDAGRGGPGGRGGGHRGGAPPRAGRRRAQAHVDCARAPRARARAAPDGRLPRRRRGRWAAAAAARQRADRLAAAVQLYRALRVRRDSGLQPQSAAPSSGWSARSSSRGRAAATGARRAAGDGRPLARPGVDGRRPRTRSRSEAGVAIAAAPAAPRWMPPSRPSAVLSVVYPHMTSVGGDAFWLIHRLRAPAACASWTRAEPPPPPRRWTLVRARGLTEIPYRGVLPATVTVPGAVDGWFEAHAAYGRLPLARLLAAAVEYARDGFPATRAARALDRGWPRRARGGSRRRRACSSPAVGRPRAGERSGIPISRGRSSASAPPGAPSFYEGETAREIARYARGRGGLYHRGGLRARSARSGASRRHATVPRRHHLRDAAAELRAVAVLQMLRLLEPFDVGASRVSLGPDHVHLLVQAKQIAFHDRDRVLADPALRGGAGRAAPLRRLRRRAPAAHRPRARAALGPRARRGEPGRRHGLRGGGGRRGQRGLADPESLRPSSARGWWRAGPASCSRTAAPTSRSIPRIPIGSSPASGRCTR